MTPEVKGKPKPSLGGFAPAKDEASEEGGEDSYESGKQAAAEAAIAALKSGDATALKDALSDFVALCM